MAQADPRPTPGRAAQRCGDTKGLAAVLRACLGDARVRVNLPLAPWTTFRIGGPADVVVEPEHPDELRLVLDHARRHLVPVTVLGGGSNILIADDGVRGLVLRLRLRGIEAQGASDVRVGSGVTMNGLVRWTLARGLGGIERWAGTPGTIGGAICGNAHFAGQAISERVATVEVIAPEGQLAVVPREAMGFDYDRSRVQASGEIVVAATFALTPGQAPDVLRSRARESLAVRKRTQPLDVPSAGCVFQNPLPGRDAVPAGLPASAGALIDAAGLKGRRIGGAVVSPVHANFIVTQPGARAADVRALIARCRAVVRDTFGVDLREEIRYLGDFGDL